MFRKSVLVLAATILLSGCWNGGNTSIRLGDVSLGQQLMDLKAALDAGAISSEEYEQTREGLLALGNACEAVEEETSWF